MLVFIRLPSSRLASLCASCLLTTHKRGFLISRLSYSRLSAKLKYTTTDIVLYPIWLLLRLYWAVFSDEIQIFVENSAEGMMLSRCQSFISFWWKSFDKIWKLHLKDFHRINTFLSFWCFAFWILFEIHKSSLKAHWLHFNYEMKFFCNLQIFIPFFNFCIILVHQSIFEWKFHTQLPYYHKSFRIRWGFKWKVNLHYCSTEARA